MFVDLLQICANRFIYIDYILRCYKIGIFLQSTKSTLAVNPILIQLILLTRLIDFDASILTFAVANKRERVKIPHSIAHTDKSVLTLEMFSRRFPYLPYGLSRLNHQLCDLFCIVHLYIALFCIRFI